MRIWYNKFLQAGIGWGCSCFPKDVSALIHTAKDYGYEAELLQSAVKVNKDQRLLAAPSRSRNCNKSSKFLKEKPLVYLV